MRSLLQEVVNLRTIARLRLLDAVLARRQKLLQRSLRICQVAEGAYLGRARFDAGWWLTAVHAMSAKSALLDNARVFPEKAGVIRAGDHAIPASDTVLIIDKHDSVGALERRTRRADSYAGRVGAVVALFGFERSQQFRPGSAMFLANPIPAVTQRNLVFGAASNHTSLAVDAFSGVDDQCISFVGHGG